MIQQHIVLLVLLVVYFFGSLAVDVYKRRTGNINTKTLAWAEKNLQRRCFPHTNLMRIFLLDPKARVKLRRRELWLKY